MTLVTHSLTHYYFESEGVTFLVIGLGAVELAPVSSPVITPVLTLDSAS